MIIFNHTRFYAGFVDSDLYKDFCKFMWLIFAVNKDFRTMADC